MNVCPECGQEFKAILPQPGPQTEFLASRWVDIIIYGGKAGGGKTWALCLDSLADVENPQYGAVFFRRKAVQITDVGGLWDKMNEVFPYLGAVSRTSPVHEWTFPSGARFIATHLLHEENKYDHMGGEFAWQGWDELTHFTETQFWYIQSRARSVSGVQPRCRATCNPDGTSWVKRFIAPWVDRKSRLKAKSGEVLWLVVVDNDEKSAAAEGTNRYLYFQTVEEAMAAAKEHHHLPDDQLRDAVKSVTFIAANLEDNQVLMQANPRYRANLLTLPRVERERLAYGNWDITDATFFEEWMPVTMDGSPWHVIPTGPLPEGYTYYIGHDWGFSAPYSAHLIGVAPDGRKIVCRECYATKRKTSEQSADMIQMIEKNGLTKAGVLAFMPHDIYNRRLNSKGEYDEPIVMTFLADGLQCVKSGADPKARADAMREHLRDWGPDEGWPDGRPGIQVMECCANLIRTIELLNADPHNPEIVDTTQEDHAFDSVGHMLTGAPVGPKIVKKPEVPDDTREKGSLAARMKMMGAPPPKSMYGRPGR